MTNSTNKDYYKILGVRQNASVEEIKGAFHRLARRYHPDVRKGADAEAQFKEISEAYSVLTNPEKRQQYDAGISSKATSPPQGHRASRGRYGHRPRAAPGTASGRFSNAREPRTFRGGSPRRVVVDLDLNVADLTTGLGVVDKLIGGLGRVLSSADRIASGRRPPPGAREGEDRDS